MARRSQDVAAPEANSADVTGRLEHLLLSMREEMRASFDRIEEKLKLPIKRRMVNGRGQSTVTVGNGTPWQDRGRSDQSAEWRRATEVKSVALPPSRPLHNSRSAVSEIGQRSLHLEGSKCQGTGHIASACGNKSIMAVKENGGYTGEEKVSGGKQDGQYNQHLVLPPLSPLKDAVDQTKLGELCVKERQESERDEHNRLSGLSKGEENWRDKHLSFFPSESRDVLPEKILRGPLLSLDFEPQFELLPRALLPHQSACRSQPPDTSVILKPVGELLCEDWMPRCLCLSVVSALFVPMNDWTWRVCVHCRAMYTIRDWDLLETPMEDFVRSADPEWERVTFDPGVLVWVLLIRIRGRILFKKGGRDVVIEPVSVASPMHEPVETL